MDVNTFKDMLEQHKAWLEDHNEGKRAVFVKFDFSKLDISGSNLTHAIFVGCDMDYVNATSCNLSGATFIECNGNCVLFTDSRLTNATFVSSSFIHSSFMHSELSYAEFVECDLRKSIFRGVKLNDCTVFTNTDLYDTDIRHQPRLNAPLACPSEGAFIGWKKVGLEKDYIVKLLIPEDAMRSSATGYKCRCDMAKVLDIQNLDGTHVDVDCDDAISQFDGKFKYAIGEMVYPNTFDPDRFNDCAPGIHFFVDRDAAVNY